VSVGKTARIKVDEREGREKFASAHDLRRAFGTRWSRIVLAPVLKELMRHADIGTTMKYYVGIQARETIDTIRMYVAKNGSEVNQEVNARGSE
jgi:integrase